MNQSAFEQMVPIDVEAKPLPMEAVMSMKGIDLLKEMIAGRLPPPPIARTLNFVLTEAEEGRVIFEGIPTPDFYNPLGTIHGGWAATILDSALGCCVHSMMAPGQGYTTVEFKTHLVRPIFGTTGRVICEGKVVHLGRTIATSEATIKTEEGKLLAHGTETCAIFPIKRDNGA